MQAFLNHHKQVSHLDLQRSTVESSDEDSFVPPHGSRGFVGNPFYAHNESFH